MGKTKTRQKNANDFSPIGDSPVSSNSNGSSHVKNSPSEKSYSESSKMVKKELHKPFRKTGKKKPFIGVSSAIGATCAIILAVGGYFVYMRIQEQKVLTPFAGPLIPYDRSYKHGLLWGTYRPGVYFGVRSRTADSVEMGLMWFPYNTNQLFLRHLCDQNDRLKYGWQQHDGRAFGYQEIIDDAVNISTVFIKRFNDQTNDWISRISVNAMPTSPSSTRKTPEGFRPTTGIFLYFRLEDKGQIQPILSDGDLIGIEGATPSLGPFRMNIRQMSEPVKTTFLATELNRVSVLQETILSGVLQNSGGGLKLIGQTTPTPNLIVLELAVQPGFILDVTYEPLQPDSAKGDGLGSWTSPDLNEVIQTKKHQFRRKFRKIFGLVEKGFTDEQNEFAQRVMSNLIGGTGYFHGESLVVSKWSAKPAKYWTTGLLTAVPSRSFFPRGFLWDEGFHQLLMSRWDVGLTREIMTSWFNLMNTDGWIPREQILGDEARSRVPDEFIVQNSQYANPPSFFLTVEAMLDNLDPDRPDEVDKTLKFFEFAFPRMQAWYNWFNTTQVGSVTGSYRWRGRNATTDRELNPKTLTSGLDDYPRASHPSEEERHVDLYCWMAFGAGVLARVAEEIGENPLPYRSAELHMKERNRLDALYWSEKHGFYADFGRHSDAVRLERPQPTKPPRPGQPSPALPKIRVVDREPKLSYVNALGYVSLFPMMLRILDVNAPTLGNCLDSLRDPNLLWTNYGIRSLAKNSPLYAAYNTEHDGPYWRGAVWINMNYLILKSLRYYGDHEGPYQAKAQKIGDELKENLVNNMFKQYQATGYVWEQYVDGEGRGSHPFTGWSSLIVLIMADM